MAVYALEKIVCLDPTVKPAPKPFAFAPAASSLQGKVVGLVDNSNLNSGRFLLHLGQFLREEYGVADLVCCGKPSASKSATDEQVQELSRRCDVVVAGVGD